MQERSWDVREVLANRSFLALWVGQLVSRAGDNFATVAALALVNQLSGSPMVIGLLALCTTLPPLFFGLVGGVFADRVDRRILMIASDVIRGVIVLLMLAVRRPEHIPLLYIGAFGLATVGAFFYPARNASIPHLVDEQHLMAANGLIQASELIALIFGAATAGFLVGYLGSDFAFLFDGGTYFFSAATLLTIHIPFNPPPERSRTTLRTLWDQMREGLGYIRSNRTLRHLMPVTAVGTLGFGAIIVLGLTYVTTVLKVGPQGLGLIYACQGLGVILGGMLIGQISERLPVHWLVAICMGLLGISIIGFAWSPHLGMVFLCTIAIGLSLVSVQASLNTLTQVLVPDEGRGRVASALSMVIGASTSASTALSGAFGSLFGVRSVFMVAGGICIVTGVVAFFTVRLPREFERPTSR